MNFNPNYLATYLKIDSNIKAKKNEYERDHYNNNTLFIANHSTSWCSYNCICFTYCLFIIPQVCIHV